MSSGGRRRGRRGRGVRGNRRGRPVARGRFNRRGLRKSKSRKSLKKVVQKEVLRLHESEIWVWNGQTSTSAPKHNRASVIPVWDFTSTAPWNHVLPPQTTGNDNNDYGFTGRQYRTPGYTKVEVSFDVNRSDAQSTFKFFFVPWNDSQGAPIQSTASVPSGYKVPDYNMFRTVGGNGGMFDIMQSVLDHKSYPGIKYLGQCNARHAASGNETETYRKLRKTFYIPVPKVPRSWRKAAGTANAKDCVYDNMKDHGDIICIAYDNQNATEEAVLGSEFRYHAMLKYKDL
jgi:hypothetical protein